LVASLFLAPGFVTSEAPLWDLAWLAIPLSLIGIVAPIFLIQKGAPQLPSGMTTIMASSELPSGILMGAAFVNDPITFLEIVGILIILAGIVLSQLDSLRAEKRSRAAPEKRTDDATMDP
jgi:drug/metabolite transporter (DMT)-like permease